MSRTFHHLQRRHYQQCGYTLLQRLLTAILIAVVFLCTACGSATAPSPPAIRIPPHTITPTPTQPISGQQLLANGALTYVAMGASDAVGVGSDDPQTQGYVYLLAQRLPAGSQLVNLGISDIRLHAALQQELPTAIAKKPELITIWLVVNDYIAGITYEHYMKDLNTLLQQLRQQTHARIVMANLPDLTRLPTIKRQLNAQQRVKAIAEIKHWNAGIQDMAARYAVTIIDLFAEGSLITAHPDYVSQDGFHPSPAGYVQLANYFWKAMQTNRTGRY
ncbi:hypothetical protein EPA93_26770 [Ktedonosporobacter rubrisoli]|uniref:SGNH hydrolase-type esterase domain-containing protein n=1 Tax=Ktedonosporobacter rubrisoli TaxID=2509675 RepID=A0A4P6JVE6_KTERU|nr:GDSL-type esterase/lipase family protein [Ktedonosporobacter rubrisoli]QBD79395.1 hypothetical protein EPA93_26770 [Ktedonosporobacter rubrisoli]